MSHDPKCGACLFYNLGKNKNGIFDKKIQWQISMKKTSPDNVLPTVTATDPENFDLPPDNLEFDLDLQHFHHHGQSDGSVLVALHSHAACESCWPHSLHSDWSVHSDPLWLPAWWKWWLCSNCLNLCLIPENCRKIAQNFILSYYTHYFNFQFWPSGQKFSFIILTLNPNFNVTKKQQQ